MAQLASVALALAVRLSALDAAANEPDDALPVADGALASVVRSVVSLAAVAIVK